MRGKEQSNIVSNIEKKEHLKPSTSFNPTEIDSYCWLCIPETKQAPLTVDAVDLDALIRNLAPRNIIYCQ